MPVNVSMEGIATVLKVKHGEPLSQQIAKPMIVIYYMIYTVMVCIQDHNPFLYCEQPVPTQASSLIHDVNSELKLLLVATIIIWREKLPSSL